MSVPFIGHLNTRLLQKAGSLLPMVACNLQSGSSAVPRHSSQGQEDLGDGVLARASWNFLCLTSAGPTPRTGRAFHGMCTCPLAFDGPALDCRFPTLLATAWKSFFSLSTTRALDRPPPLGTCLGRSLFSGELSGESSMTINS